MGSQEPEENDPTYFKINVPDNAGEPIRNVELPKPAADPGGFEPQVPVPGEVPPPEASGPSHVSAAAERKARMEGVRERQQSRKRRNFIIGLIAGQALIVAIDLGAPQLNRLKGMRLDVQRLPLLVCMGVVGGLALTAAFITLLLLGSGAAGLFKGGSLKRGLARTARAIGAVILTTAVLGGTAFFMMPRAQWKTAPTQAWAIVVDGWQKIRMK